MESYEEESTRSKEDDDGASNGEESEGDDDASRDVSDQEDDDKEEEAGREAPCPRPATGTAVVSNPETSPGRHPRAWSVKRAAPWTWRSSSMPLSWRRDARSRPSTSR